ncbi:hypothetical protein [Sphingomonas sp.]|uniref:hypothetical protein n=1 Tax=Sphingomonas sp. TaxID=28214 RepID=UPI002612F040|nr:hypothetical protein [Sphingomonas sp.]MDK2767078.1 hypothetical protein [Sphingomonas sp.]
MGNIPKSDHRTLRPLCRKSVPAARFVASARHFVPDAWHAIALAPFALGIAAPQHINGRKNRTILDADLALQIFKGERS